MTYGLGSWSEKMGNHRAVIRVTKEAPAVKVTIRWRRRDAFPEKKAVWITDAQGNRIERVVTFEADREKGTVVFEPSAGEGLYYVYYMPYVTEGWWAFPSVRYILGEEQNATEWTHWRDFPKAELQEIQAINDFHRFDPMELPATREEMASFLRQHEDLPFLLFPEDRRYPIRMKDELPLRWIEAGPAKPLHGQPLQGEFYAFQIGVFAKDSDLDDVRVLFRDVKQEGTDQQLAASAFRCINTGGTDCLGQPLEKEVSVPKGQVQPLWCGVQVDEDQSPGSYEGTVTVNVPGLHSQQIDLVLNVQNEGIAEAGAHDLWRHARLAWLDSTIGLDDEVFDPYTPVDWSKKKKTVSILGRKLTLGPDGLPKSIVSTFGRSVDHVKAPPREILSAPITLNALREGNLVEWNHTDFGVVDRASGALSWQAQSTAPDFRRSVRAKMECDGHVNLWITLQAKKNATLDDVFLEMPVDRDVARFMLGLGRKGGVRPEAWDWTWDVTRSNCYVWLGDVNAGVQCKLKHLTPDWSLYGLHNTGVYKDWSGQGKGGCALREEKQSVVFRAFTGPLSVKEGQPLHFHFALLITPLKVLDQQHWNWRYYHASTAKPVPEVAKTGATVINLHQGDALNPHINYPFRTVDPLASYSQEAHERDMRVKIYYTVRELSNYTEEFWALRSLGDEVFRMGPGFKLADHFLEKKASSDNLPKTGSSWLCEHAITDYVPAWHQPLGNGHYDAAVAQQGLSRWHNYYLEGLRYLIEHVGIDGLYLDGVGYDREIMKRVRKVMQRTRPGCLIDFHSGNNFHANYGQNNVVGQYMELLPCMDSLWFGEGFDYNEPPDYWLVEISGIPFGLFGEMLHGGGNPWRGMVFGMTNRLGWSGDPKAIWKVWDQFGIDQAQMIGHWDPANPVTTGRDDLLATTYLRRDGKAKALIALASWAETMVPCRLTVDLSVLGLDPGKAHLYAPPVQGFQPAALFDLEEKIPVAPGRGWLLFLEDVPREKPVSDVNDPVKGKALLLEDPFHGTALGEDWNVKVSARQGTSLTVAEEALVIEAAANSIAFAERPLPQGVEAVTCKVQQGTDKGASWGPGLALVWSSGKALRVNVRVEGRVGVYGWKGEILTPMALPSQEFTLAMVLEQEEIQVLASHDCSFWQTVAQVPREAFPGDPKLVRLGKMGLSSHEKDFHIPGDPGRCTLQELRVWGNPLP